MSAVARARQLPAPPFIDLPSYSRHRPERRLLYQLVEQHYPAFRELRAAAERPLPERAAGVRGVSQVRTAGAGVPAGALRAMSRREARGVQLQIARLLPLLFEGDHRHATALNCFSYELTKRVRAIARP